MTTAIHRPSALCCAPPVPPGMRVHPIVPTARVSPREHRPGTAKARLPRASWSWPHAATTVTSDDHTWPRPLAGNHRRMTSP
jgi:hypothetical protein